MGALDIVQALTGVEDEDGCRRCACAARANGTYNRNERSSGRRVMERATGLLEVPAPTEAI